MCVGVSGGRLKRMGGCGGGRVGAAINGISQAWAEEDSAGNWRRELFFFFFL